MIRIRYREVSELRPGYHADAERDGRATIVYLLTGISTAQRRKALRRLRTWAGRGQCPPLPRWQLAVALAADRVRHARAGLAVHPATATVPVMVVSLAAIVYLGLTTVSVHVLPRGAALPPSTGAEPAVPAAGGAPASQPPGPATRYAPGTPGAGATAPASRPGATRAASSTVASRATPAAAGQAPGQAPAATVPASSQAAATAPPASPASPAPTPASTNTSGGVCMDVGPFGVCLHRP